MIQHTLEKAEHILVIAHVDPDGDAIGSLAAVGLALQQMELCITLVCDDNVPERFKYVPMADKVQKSVNGSQPFDLLIAVDCGDEFRMGRAFSDLTGPKPFIINIDHHITNTRFGDINVVDPQATSTTEILYRLFSEMHIDISPDIALALLTGLVTDTLGFRTNNVNANTLHTAADLVEAGADLGFVTMHALNLRSLSTLELWRTGMNNMQMDQGLIWTTITKGERRAANFRSNSSVGLVNLLADVDQVSMGAVLMEMDNGTVKVGLRCRPPFDVSEVAVAFGGGGHALAAGCTMSGPLAKAEAVIVRACQEAIARQSQPVASLEASP